MTSHDHTWETVASTYDGDVVKCSECGIPYPKNTSWHTDFRPVAPRKETAQHIKDDCPRCHGTGYINQYSHVQNGVCFLCA